MTTGAGTGTASSRREKEDTRHSVAEYYDMIEKEYPMTKLQIRMRQVDQVKDFVDLLSKYPYEMDLVSGRYTIDAKSLLGIYSLDLSNPLTLVIYSDSCEELLTQLHALLPDCIV